MKDQEYSELLSGSKNYIVIENGQINTDDFLKESTILSGSFNPLHNGHIGLLKTAKNMTKLDAFFEISISNVDKRNINLEDLNSRIKQFRSVGKLLITNSPTFEDKSNIFKKSIFVIGYDTAVRIFDKKYYKKDMHQSLSNIYKNGCSFLVTGREKDGKYKSMRDINIEDYKELFSIIPEENFRLDISSTELRKRL
ncbi:MAG: hypothetical protein CL762_04705 [Chloroflexi bacterium]|nr:hypothetical protein [Chloroflexota bacterium]|tara:strand:+ start:1440 stop:2027 length:588 start_codon:yes stop_codon:yes gene_type:complete